MLSHHDPRVVNYAVKIYEAMLDSWVGGAPKKGVGKKAGGGKGGGEEAGEALQVALIEQACVPLLFTMCRVGSRKYSPTFFVCEKVLKALVRKVADFESNKEKVSETDKQTNCVFSTLSLLLTSSPRRCSRALVG